MKTTHNRALRLGEQIRRSLGIILNRQKHPYDFSGVSITAVKASPDLSTATVYITNLIAEVEQQQIEFDLNEASSFLRKKLSQNLNLRKTPKLTFKYDKSIEFSSKLEKLISTVSRKTKANG